MFQDASPDGPLIKVHTPTVPSGYWHTQGVRIRNSDYNMYSPTTFVVLGKVSFSDVGVRLFTGREKWVRPVLVLPRRRVQPVLVLTRWPYPLSFFWLDLVEGSFTLSAATAMEIKFFSFKNGLHWSLWSCSHGDLRQWQWQLQWHRHQMGSVPNCDGNGNDTKIKCRCRRSVNEPRGSGEGRGGEGEGVPWPGDLNPFPFLTPFPSPLDQV